MCQRSIANGSILWFSDLESLLFQEQIDSRVEDIGSSLLTHLLTHEESKWYLTLTVDDD